MKISFKRSIFRFLFFLGIFTLALGAHAQIGIGTTIVNPSAELDVVSTTKGLLAPRMTLAQRNLISVPATGLLVFQTDNTPGFYFYNGSSWTSASGTPGVDLTSDQSVDGKKTFISTDGLVATGTLGSGTASTLGRGTRMMWYPKKSAFRAGTAAGDEWDDAKIGGFSTAIGGATTASGQFSTAMGFFSAASGEGSTAMGASSTASGGASTAMGSSSTASGDISTAMGIHTTAKSFCETVIGSYNTDYTATSTLNFDAFDRLFVIGNGAASNALSDALVMLKNGNTTLGGSLAVNGNGTGTSYTLPTGRGTASYVLTTDGSGATSWAAAASGGGGSGVDLTTAQSVDGKKTFISTDGLVATGTFGSGTASTLGAGTRMMWYPKKAAFRAGTAGGDEWDDAKIGDYSTAMGNETTAGGEYSTAMGAWTIASAYGATAMGTENTASGNNSTAMGYGTEASVTCSTAMGLYTTASGRASTAMGNHTTAKSFCETVIGSYNTDYTATATSTFLATDRLFVIGNGAARNALSDALVMLKNGNTTLGGSLAVNGNGTGTSYTLPTGRGTASYVLTTDGSGATSWAAAASGGGGSGVDLTTDQSVDGKKTFISTDGLVATGTLGSGTASTLGAGTRMMWYPKKAAFRAGSAGGDEWDDANIGDNSTAMGNMTNAGGEYSTAMGAWTIASAYGATAMGTEGTASGENSTAMGYGTEASGPGSTAMGDNTTASGNISTAMGDNTNASGEVSTAMGKNSTASGEGSTAMGLRTTAKSYFETAIGSNNTDYTPVSTTSINAIDRLFVIGNGDPNGASSDALVMLKNGNTTFSGTVTATVVAPTSDVRLKRNIVPLKNSIEALMQLKPVSYEKKNSLTSTEYNIKENGFIAQELQKVMPTLVVEGTDKDKLLSVNYTAIIPVLTKAIQEQQSVISGQHNEIGDLKKELDELKKMMQQLLNKK